MPTSAHSLVIASANPGKLNEFQRLLAPLGFTLYSQRDFSQTEVEETGLTFVENALIKARAASSLSGFAAIADDSGLVVDALKGAPGIYSARYAGEPSNDVANNTKLLQALEEITEDKRTAHYWCALVYLRYPEDPAPIIVQKGWSGEILRAPRGENGFGYDSLFFLPALNKTVAELTMADKNRLSHRGRAVAALCDALSETC